MTWSTMARPQIMCSGLGRVERIRVPSPAARMIALTLMMRFPSWLRGEELNPYSLIQNQVSCLLNDPGSQPAAKVPGRNRGCAR